MFGFRFSLAQLAMVMLVICLGCAAIVSANSITASLCLTVFFIGNLVAATRSLTTTGPSRAFWIGMAIFGWGYWWQHEPTLLREDYSSRSRSMGYGYQYGFIGGFVPDSGDGHKVPPRLSTEWLLDQVYRYSARSPKVGEKVIARWMGGSFFPGVVKEIGEGDYLVQWDDGSAASPVASRDVHNQGSGFYVTGHSVFGVFFALLGGILGLSFFGPKGEEGATAPVAAAPTSLAATAPPTA